MGTRTQPVVLPSTGEVDDAEATRTSCDRESVRPTDITVHTRKPLRLLWTVAISCKLLSTGKHFINRYRK